MRWDGEECARSIQPETAAARLHIAPVGGRKQLVCGMLVGMNDTSDRAIKDMITGVLDVGEVEEVWCVPHREFSNHFCILLVLKDNAKDRPRKLPKNMEGVEFTFLFVDACEFKKFESQIREWNFCRIYPPSASSGVSSA
jgi:hypothetical protein